LKTYNRKKANKCLYAEIDKWGDMGEFWSPAILGKKNYIGVPLIKEEQRLVLPCSLLDSSQDYMCNDQDFETLILIISNNVKE
jgi:hypothetical protein